MKLSVQYVNDQAGKTTAVQIPIVEWEKLMKKHIHLETLMKIKSDFEQSYKEVALMQSGKLKKQTLSDFLNKI